jgi:hypothetical protein
MSVHGVNMNTLRVFPAVARLRPGDNYQQLSGLRNKFIQYCSTAEGRVIAITRLEPSDCDLGNVPSFLKTF